MALTFGPTTVTSRAGRDSRTTAEPRTTVEP
jgi:hypothetical protein